MNVMIGIDPHKATHTAVAIDNNEEVLDEVKVRASKVQAQRLRSWAERFEARTWAVESAGGLGYLVAQQLVAAGEMVVDVPAVLASDSPWVSRRLLMSHVAGELQIEQLRIGNGGSSDHLAIHVTLHP